MYFFLNSKIRDERTVSEIPRSSAILWYDFSWSPCSRTISNVSRFERMVRDLSLEPPKEEHPSEVELVDAAFARIVAWLGDGTRPGVEGAKGLATREARLGIHGGVERVGVAGHGALVFAPTPVLPPVVRHDTARDRRDPDDERIVLRRRRAFERLHGLGESVLREVFGDVGRHLLRDGGEDPAPNIVTSEERAEGFRRDRRSGHASAVVGEADWGAHGARGSAGLAGTGTSFARRRVGASGTVTGVARRRVGASGAVTRVARRCVGASGTVIGGARRCAGASSTVTGGARRCAGASSRITGVARRCAGASSRVTGVARRCAGASSRVTGVARRCAGASSTVIGFGRRFDRLRSPARGPRGPTHLPVRPMRRCPSLTRRLRELVSGRCRSARPRASPLDGRREPVRLPGEPMAPRRGRPRLPRSPTRPGRPMIRPASRRMVDRGGAARKSRATKRRPRPFGPIDRPRENISEIRPPTRGLFL